MHPPTFEVYTALIVHTTMAYARGKRPYSLQRDFNVLAREQRVTKILGSDAFRAELEDILQSQLEGTWSPPKTRALHALQEGVAPAVPGVATAGRHAGMLHAAVLPINDLRGALASRYTLTERQLRCKLASLCRLVDWFQWSQLVQNHVSVSMRVTGCSLRFNGHIYYTQPRPSIAAPSIIIYPLLRRAL